MTDFKAKMHQIRFRLGLTALPQTLSWISGALLLRKGTGREGRGGMGRGGEGREKERTMSPPVFGGSLRLWICVR